jgi:hypothetical protein
VVLVKQLSQIQRLDAPNQCEISGLVALLPYLRVKHKDWELSFLLDEAEREAAAIPVSPQTPELQPTPEEEAKFERLAEISPRAAILEIRYTIEEALQSLTKAAGFPLQRASSALSTIRILRSAGIIDAQVSALLDDLRVVGNNAAHATGVEFTTAEALQYRQLCNKAIDRLRSIENNLPPRPVP